MLVSAMQRYVCEVKADGEMEAPATQRWLLLATDEQAAMDEMLDLYASKFDDRGSSTLLLVQVSEEEWQALQRHA